MMSEDQVQDISSFVCEIAVVECQKEGIEQKLVEVSKVTERGVSISSRYCPRGPGRRQMTMIRRWIREEPATAWNSNDKTERGVQHKLQDGSRRVPPSLPLSCGM